MLALLTALLVLIPSGPAEAHAYLVESTPSDGSVHDVAPRALRLRFNEPVVLSATRVDVVDGAGVHHPVSDLALAQGAGTAVQVVAALPDLGKGAYRVEWQTLSSDDLHRTGGDLVYGVGQDVRAAGSHEATPSAGETSLRLLLLLSLSLSLGGLAVEQLLRRQPVPAPLLGTSRGAALVGAVVGALVAAALLLVQARSGHLAVRQVVAGGYGPRWFLREGGFGLLALAAAVPAWRGRVPAASTGAAATCVGSALLAHRGADSVGQVVAGSAHVAAAGVWVGGLLVLVTLGVVGRRRTDVSAPVARAVLRAVALPALTCLAVLVPTGLYLSGDLVGSVDALLLTTYGRVLLVKALLLLVVAALAAGNHRAVRHREGLPRRLLVAEASAGALLLGAAALLVSGQPALEPQLVSRTGPSAVAAVDASVGDLQQTLSLRPNLPGRNVVTVDVFDTRRPAPAPITRVLVALPGRDGRHTDPQPAQPAADGRWQLGAEVAQPGTTSVEVIVERAGLPDATRRYRWVVSASTAPARYARVSTAPIGPLLHTCALVVGALALAVVAVAACRGRRRER